MVGGGVVAAVVIGWVSMDGDGWGQEAGDVMCSMGGGGGQLRWGRIRVAAGCNTKGGEGGGRFGMGGGYLIDLGLSVEYYWLMGVMAVG
jgi:hypothetical protein